MQQTIAKFPYFEVLKPQDIDWIVSHSNPEDCQPGRVLIQEGHPVEFIYLLLSGLLNVIVSREGEGAQELKKLDPGEMMGEMSFLDDRPPAATIKVVKPSQVLFICKQDLARKLEKDGDFAARFYRLVSLKLSNQLRGLSQLLTQTQATVSQPLRKVLVVFAILNDRDIAWAIANGNAQKVSAGQVLIKQGKAVPAVYVLLEGTLGIYISNDQQVEKEVGTSSKGEIIGEMSFVETGTASATVKAIERSWLLAIPQAKLASKLAEDRGFAARFYRAIAIVLSQRWRDRLFLRGFATLALDQTQMLSEEIAVADELDFEAIEGTAIAGTRFDWMLGQLRR